MVRASPTFPERFHSVLLKERGVSFQEHPIANARIGKGTDHFPCERLTCHSRSNNQGRVLPIQPTRVLG